MNEKYKHCTTRAKSVWRENQSVAFTFLPSLWSFMCEIFLSLMLPFLSNLDKALKSYYHITRS